MAIYVSPPNGELCVQIGREIRPVDGATIATHRWLFRGAVSQLTVSRPDRPDLTVRAVVILRRVLRAFEKDYEEMSAPDSDFLLNVADITRSRTRQESVTDWWRVDGKPFD